MESIRPFFFVAHMFLQKTKEFLTRKLHLWSKISFRIQKNVVKVIVRKPCRMPLLSGQVWNPSEGAIRKAVFGGPITTPYISTLEDHPMTCI